MTAPAALSIVGATAVLGVCAAIVIIRANRRRAYAAWPRPARWAWYALCAVLITLGAAVLVNDYVTDWGWQAALWLLAAPLAYGLFHGLTARRSP